jgi:hypothetical protein
MDLLHWKGNGPAANTRAVAFFQQHPKGVSVSMLRATPGIRGKFAGDPGVPSTEHFIVTTGDGVARWCSPGKHWTWDGRKFAAEVCTEACSTP